MTDELQTTETDSSEGQGDVSSAGFDLPTLNQITGREFKDVEDFKKHYENLSSFVGKKDEAGDKLKSILSKAEPYASKYGLPADEFLSYYLDNPTATEDDIKGHFQQRMTPKNDEVQTKVSKLEFLVEHPEAKGDYEFISTIARGKGISLEEALVSPEYKRVAGASREPKGTSVINSNTKVTISASEQAKAKDKVLRTGSTDALAGYLQETGFVD